MNLLLDLLVSVIGVGTVGQYVWSMGRHFHSPNKPQGSWVVSTMVISTTLFFLALIWMLDQPVQAQLVGLVVQLASIALFWWAISASKQARLKYVFDAGNPETLVMEGPYRFVRHPFYTSYLMFWTGWGIATWSIWALVPLACMYTMYTRAALDEEKKFSRTAFAETYSEYRKRAGLFWPRLGFAKSRA